MPKDNTTAVASLPRSPLSTPYSAGGGRTLRSSTSFRSSASPQLPQQRDQPTAKIAFAASAEGSRNAPADGTDTLEAESEGISPAIAATTALTGSGMQEPAPAREELQALTAALARANRCVGAKKRTLSKARSELADSKAQVKELNAEIDELKDQLERTEKQMNQYRNWWLNEVQFTKLILNKVPNANQDWDLVRTSQSHYLGRF
ncbi:hypothetical protein BKA70DRAFT_1431514 [Coprinopsis sp. MPI-PUGE-AT-0042]|nr:hypothetical protein BKA70DRAFT_1431514 [Coprinopsis sp. MPI-PUGE-AT-0042]